MSDRHAEYWERAEYCERQSLQAPRPELRAHWLRLAECWRDMAADKQAIASEKFEQLLQDKGTHQTDSTSAH